ncbi:MAG TPA: nucleotide disphospho-sugar-binding domain-containing protein [Gemmata sp.]
MAKIVFATFGSLGDVHPFIALGHALQERNHDVVLAVPDAHTAKVRAAGLEAASIFPPFEEVGRRLHFTSEEEVVRKVMEDPHFCIRDFLVPSLMESCASLLSASEGASAIVGQFLALAGPIVAEKMNVPYIPAHMHPMSFLSATDPPSGAQFRVLVPAPRWSVSRRWNRGWVRLMRFFLKHRYARYVDPVRRAYGLPPVTRSPIFDTERAAPLTLGLYSRALGAPQDDFPPNTHIVGFPMFDSESGRPQPVDANLLRFLAAGPPPVVFTLGSLAVFAAGNFYSDSLAVARALGRRAVLLTGVERNAPVADESVFVCRYAPHSAVFPKSAAVVHHGGMGTMGQALRAGVPQLVVPHLGDQWDNGARAARLGFGRVLDARHYTAPRATALLRELLSDPTVGTRVTQLRQVVCNESGARTGAAVLDAFLARAPIG